MLWCVPPHLFWFRSTGVLYEMTHWNSLMLQLLGSVWTNKDGVKASLHCGDNGESLCEKGSTNHKTHKYYVHGLYIWTNSYTQTIKLAFHHGVVLALFALKLNKTVNISMTFNCQYQNQKCFFWSPRGSCLRYSCCHLKFLENMQTNKNYT